MKAKILIVDDEYAICQSLTFLLNSKYDVVIMTEAKNVVQKVQEEAVDVVLLDLCIGEADGIEVLKAIKTKMPNVQVIMMTAYGSIRSSVDAMKHGALNYLTKPLDTEELLIFIEHALKLRSLTETVRYLSSELRSLNEMGYGGLVGKSAGMQRCYSLIDRVKDVNASVVISGESGCGKELVARAIHHLSNRSNQRFVALNCSAIPENLLEEELFGHKKGSFTGAVGTRKGKLACADGGTLFLDEVGDMSLAMQKKMLRVLQEREYSPLGDNNVYKIDIRVVAATNKKLKEMIQTGEFREDLYYRLNVIEITVPPLRERTEDIPLLCEHFLKKFSTEKGYAVTQIGPSAMKKLMEYHYPGNVRELMNILEYAMIVSEGNTITSEMLPELFDRGGNRTCDFEAFLASMSLDELEKRAICAHWRASGEKQVAAAKSLGISERGLRNKLYQYQLLSQNEKTDSVL